MEQEKQQQLEELEIIKQEKRSLKRLQFILFVENLLLIIAGNSILNYIVKNGGLK